MFVESIKENYKLFTSGKFAQYLTDTKEFMNSNVCPFKVFIAIMVRFNTFFCKLETKSKLGLFISSTDGDWRQNHRSMRESGCKNPFINHAQSKIG